MIYRVVLFARISNTVEHLQYCNKHGSLSNASSISFFFCFVDAGVIDVPQQPGYMLQLLHESITAKYVWWQSCWNCKTTVSAILSSCAHFLLQWAGDIPVFSIFSSVRSSYIYQSRTMSKGLRAGVWQLQVRYWSIEFFLAARIGMWQVFEWCNLLQ